MKKSDRQNVHVSEYILVESSDISCNFITSVSECEKAATYLGLSDTSAEVDGPQAQDPPNCYFEKGSGSKWELKFHSFGTNTGVCGDEATATNDKCLCRGRSVDDIAATTSSATTTTMSTTSTTTTIACLIEENVEYAAGNDSNDGLNEPRQNDAESCQSFCESNYPTAMYFTWHSTSSAWVPGRETCWCKSSNTGMSPKPGVYSGDICRVTTTSTITSSMSTTVSNPRSKNKKGLDK